MNRSAVVLAAALLSGVGINSRSRSTSQAGAPPAAPPSSRESDTSNTDKA
jgi:hypothetical protein